MNILTLRALICKVRILAVFDAKNRSLHVALLWKETVSHAMDGQEVAGSASLQLELVA
jgi:hypothetical protein